MARSRPSAARRSKRVTICVLTYGEYPELARRALSSIFKHCRREEYDLVVGANEPCAATERLLRESKAMGHIDRLIVSAVNLNKNPMMRRMFRGITTEFIWWLDDDSHLTDRRALARRLAAADAASPQVAMWGSVGFSDSTRIFTHLKRPLEFVRTAKWYRGLPPPAWRPGGKGEFDFMGHNAGDGRWFFVPGGDFFIRTSAVRKLDWPDRRLVKNGEDVFLGEAVRQQGWELGEIHPLGVKVGDAPRRGDIGLGYTD